MLHEEQGSAPRNVQARPLSSTTILIQWDQPEEPSGQVTGYKIYYTTTPIVPLSSWETQTVDNNQMTTVAELKPLQIYTIKVQAFTQRGPGPLSVPVQVKTQQGVPGQPQELRTGTVSATTVQLNWKKPAHSREAITGYEIYWNDTFTHQEYRRSIPAVESFTLGELYPDTLYWVWVAGKSIRGEGAATPPIPVRTEQYGQYPQFNLSFLSLSLFFLSFSFLFFRSLFLLFLSLPILLTSYFSHLSSLLKNPSWVQSLRFLFSS